MRLNRTVSITGAMVTSNIPETVSDAAAYAAGTTYAINAVVSVATGLNLIFYRSLQNANVGHTPASSPTWWKEISTGYLAWASGTAYVVNDYCTYANKIYKCLINNTNYQPDLNTGGATPRWLDCGATNRHKAFDVKSSSQASLADEITYTITPGTLIDTITIQDAEATEIEIIITDPTAGIVYQETFDLVNNAAVIDAYTYFFAPIITRDAVVTIGLPPYSAASIAITITNTGGYAKVGNIGLGTQKYLGITQYGASFRILDYSIFEANDFGDLTITERTYSKQVECEVIVEGGSDEFDDVNKTLAELRATAGVWIFTDEGYSSLIVFGLCRDFYTVAEGPGWSRLRIKVLGLS